MTRWTRRAACRGLLAAPLILARTPGSAAGAPEPSNTPPPGTASPAAALAAIERRLGGRLGVCVGGETGILLAHRADERFPLCSTFKVLIAAAILARVDAGTESLDRALAYGPADLLDYAPVTRAALEAGGGAGRISVSDACAAALVWGDNTAANLLLAALAGSLDAGPAALTAWLRGLGDATTRLDRPEPALNAATPGDRRDTTTPAAMRDTLARVLAGPVLSPASRGRLEDWMVASRTGLKRLRAGLPPDWRVGDKTGTGEEGTVNDVAIFYPPGPAPLIAAVYVTGSRASAETYAAAYAEVGRLAAEAAVARRP